MQGLLHLRKFCDVNDLEYYLGFGTLLGAVRHQGFIPWDDDIDVFMLREDYERLLSLTDQLNNNEWELYSYKTKKGYGYPWAKLCRKGTEILPPRFASGLVYGCSIDVFPVDYVAGTTETEALQEAEYFRRRYTKEFKRYHVSGVFRTGFAGAVARLLKKGLFSIAEIMWGEWSRRLNEIEMEIHHRAHGNRKFVGHLLWPVLYCVWVKTDFTEDGKVGRLLFEGQEFRVPLHPERILEARYGNYMELPPIEKRIIPHSFHAYYAEK